jgi:ABC-type transport system involved in multi-copper enzyme maturation permease subunit
MHQLVEAVGGPVLAWESKRAARGYVRKFFALGYAVWLLLLALGVLSATRSAVATPPAPADSYLSQARASDAQLLLFLDSFVALLLQFQLKLVIAITPAIMASCLGQEKERGTLFALFGTQLTSRQIVLGKLLGRLALMVPVFITALPVLVFMVTATGQGFTILMLALAQQMIVAFTLGAVCLLFGIWLRRTADAVIVSYVVLGLGYVLGRGLSASVPEAFWFDPVDNLDTLLREGTWLAFVCHLAAWALLGAACLPVAWARLRKVCLQQRDKRPSRRIWAFRPPVGNNAVRWRECYVIGLAPMPILRMVPRWLGLVGVFTFSAAVAGLIADHVAPGFLAALWNMNLVRAFADLRTQRDAIAESVWLMGLVFVLLADLLLLVRCLTSVAEEKRRNTWDDLLLTAQSFREIINGKMWGILQATVPFIIAFALPVCLLAAVGGPKAMCIAALWIILPCVTVFGAALMGIDMLRVPRDMDETRQGGAFWVHPTKACFVSWMPRILSLKNSRSRKP